MANGRKRRNTIGGGGSGGDRSKGANRTKDKKRRDKLKKIGVEDQDIKGTLKSETIREEKDKLRERKDKLKKIAIKDQDLKSATDRYRQQRKESVIRSFKIKTANRDRIARLNQDAEGRGPRRQGPLPQLPRLRSNTIAADSSIAKRPGSESIVNFRKKVGDKMADKVKSPIRTLDSAKEGAYQASFFEGSDGSAVLLNKMGDTSEITIKEIQNDFNRIKNETDIYSENSDGDPQLRDIYIKNDGVSNFDNVLDTINKQLDPSDPRRYVRVFDMDDISIIHLQLRGREEIERSDREERVKRNKKPFDDQNKVELNELENQDRLGLKSKMKKLEDSIKKQRIIDYNVPVEKWGSIWERKTRSKLYRTRDPNKIKIDTKLINFIEQKKAKDYDGGEKTLKELDEMLDDFGNKDRATERLHIAIKQQRRKEQMGRYLEQNTGVRSDPKVAEFSDDPRKMYNEVVKRKEEYKKNNPKDPRNFPFPEIGGTLNNMQDYIENVKLRLQFGREDRPAKDGETPSEFRVQVHANASDRLKSELLDGLESLGGKSVLDKVLEDIKKLEEDGYPYKDTIKQTIQFTKLIDYITYRSKTEPEILALIGDEKNLQAGDNVPQREVNGDVYKAIQKQRNKKFNTDEGAEAGFIKYDITATALRVYEGTANTKGDEVGYAGIYRFEKFNGPDGTPNRVDWVLNQDDIVLFPSYEELDTEFFVDAQGVPMYMVGMLNIEYLNADNIRQSPATFFEHDLFHIIGHEDTKRNEQQYQSFNNAIKRWQVDTDSPKFSKDDIARFWRKNGDSLDSRINKLITDAEALQNENALKEANDLKDALSMLLFMALHEPIKLDSLSTGDKDTILGSIIGRPTVLETEPLVNRIGVEWTTQEGEDNSFVKVLKERILRGEFGKVDSAVVNQLENAKNWLVNTIPSVFATEPKPNDEYARQLGKIGEAQNSLELLTTK